MTNYQCSGCELIFEDWDPMPMGDTGVVVLPTCPTAEALCDILFRQQHEGFPVLETLAQQQEQIEDEHIVRLYIAPKVVPVKPSGPWSKPLTIKEDTPKEKEARELQAKVEAIQRKRRQENDELDRNARQLIQRIDREIQQGDGQKSSNFPNDLEYGTKVGGSPYKASVAVITRASTLWLARGQPDYTFRPLTFKALWGVRMANFEQSITPGNRNGGKHNFHVTEQR